LIQTFLDAALHVDRHLAQLAAQYHGAIYAILFAVIFAETGLVVTPFLPGDSLLFASGALAASGGGGPLEAPALWALLAAAAALGNTTNCAIGRTVGSRAFSGRHRLFRLEHLYRTEAFFQRYGAMTIVLSRFMPIIRTFAPFVAGIGRMPYLRFQAYNVLGAAAWTALFVWGGYLFGNIPIVKANFGLVTLGIIVISLMPMGWAALKARRQSRRP
jgi:membrane-associated protein